MGRWENGEAGARGNARAVSAAIGQASTPWERGVGHQRRESIRPCALKPAWRKRQGVAFRPGCGKGR